MCTPFPDGLAVHAHMGRIDRFLHAVGPGLGGRDRRMRAYPRYKSTPSVAVRVVPLYEAEIVAVVEMSTMDVLTVKLALLAPAGTNTLKGALAAPLLLERKT